jgi:nucleolar pre-ribosomal-associated protein 1
LVDLRNQLAIKFDEPAIAPQDERLLLAQRWMESVPGAHDLFEVWEGATQVRVLTLPS